MSQQLKHQQQEQQSVHSISVTCKNMEEVTLWFLAKPEAPGVDPKILMSCSLDLESGESIGKALVSNCRKLRTMVQNLGRVN